MKSICTALTFFIGFGLTSQIIITEEDFPSAGDVNGISNGSDVTTDFNDAGIWYIWDYSDIPETTQTTETIYSISDGGFVLDLQFGMFAPPAYKADYFQKYEGLPIDQLTNLIPGFEIGAINKVVKSTNEKVTTVGFSIDMQGTQIGFKSDTIETTHMFPMEYGNTFTSSGYTDFDFNPFFDARLITHRKTTTTVDGYGELVTPFGLHHNTLRVRHDIDELDSIHIVMEVFGFPVDQWIPINRNLHYYEWWDKDKKRPLLRIETEGVFGNDFPTSITFLNNIVLGVDVNNFEVALYPNPTADRLHINSKEKLVEVILIDANGKIVIQEAVNGTVHQLDVSPLSSGMYFLHSISENARNINKIVIE